VRFEPAELIDFWLDERARPMWFNSTEAFDRQLCRRFQALYEAARDDRLTSWESSADGALALVIALDQLPLNMFRDDPRSFATEAAARAVADRAIRAGFDQQLDPERKMFLYMPFMHSESMPDQDRSVALFGQPGLEQQMGYARHHRDIVDRFGRFPHRNAILGRASTAQERSYLAAEGAFRG
jgi:uncharacterized protein (DUF924 family)